MKIEDWLDIFIYQKKIKDFSEYNSLNEERQKVINQSLIRIDNYFEEIYKDKEGNIDKSYFHYFLVLIYNLRRFLWISEKRNPKKKIIKNIRKLIL